MNGEQLSNIKQKYLNETNKKNKTKIDWVKTNMRKNFNAQFKINKKLGI